MRSERLRQAILERMAEHSMNISDVAQEIHYHRNTVVYHLEEIKKKTGKDPRTFYGLCELLGYERKENNNGQQDLHGV